MNVYMYRYMWAGKICIQEKIPATEIGYVKKKSSVKYLVYSHFIAVQYSLKNVTNIKVVIDKNCNNDNILHFWCQN